MDAVPGGRLFAITEGDGEAPDRLNALIVDFLTPLRPWA
jgi:hypothetical protein